MYLSPKLYHFVQYVAHGNYASTLNRLNKMLCVHHGDVVVELGCGDGGFAEYFLKQGCKYFGIDQDEERIIIAKKKILEGSFITGNLMNFDFNSIPKSKHYFCHGLLHHLDDEQCHKLIKRVMSINNDMKFVTIEPIRPNPWYSNPIATFLANMDDGDYIRTHNSWKNLLNEWLKKSETMNRLPPRWLVPAMFALLVPQSKATESM